MTKSSAEHAVEVESAFLAGVQANLKTVGGRLIAGAWFERQEHDDGERVRAAMADRRIYDRDRLAKMPHGRGITVRGYERRWLFGRRLRSVTIANIFAPPGPLLESDKSAPPVSFAELKAHVEGLVVDRKTPHLIGVCSPSGFCDEVWNMPLDVANVTLVLVEPRESGGWRVRATKSSLDQRLLRLFDPEDVGQKIARVRREIEERSIDLLTGGLTASSIAERLDLPEALVQAGFEEAAKTDPELRVSKRSGEALLYRGAARLSDREDNSMSLAEWIKSLFSREGEEEKKIDLLKERRAALSGKLDRMYEDIGKLEKREEQLLVDGKANASKIAKRRIAAQIAHLRKDVSRCNTSAAMLSKQMNVISTHIHNLELARTGSVAELPSGEELTEAAVAAEEILEQLSASDDLISGLEVGLAESAVSDDEAAILKELEGDGGEKEPKTKEGGRAADRPAGEGDSKQRQRGPAQAE